MSQHKGETTGWYVSKELPGRYPNPKNILREYFLDYFVKRYARWTKNLPGFL
jgi:hypothetical protein